MWHAHDGMGWWMVFGTLMWILLIAGLAFAIVSLANQPRGGTTSPRHETPLDIARRRYASGELTREQFEQLRRDLTDSRRASVGT